MPPKSSAPANMLPMCKSRPTVANAKIGRARQHSLELQARIVGWSASVDLQPIAEISADRLSWTLRLPAFDPPPLDEWALILGDGIHNVRSALDVLVWAYVDQSELTDGQKKSISFPIWTEPQDWDKHSSRLLRTVPTEVVQRIHHCQPFQRPEAERSGDLLPLLAELDNQDKHRLTIVPAVQFNQMEVAHSVEFANDDAAARNVPPDVTVHAPSLIPEGLLFSGTTKDPIERIGGSATVQAQFGVETANGFVGVVELVESLAYYAAQVIDYVSS